jgi:antitoxin component YwqK of YwqJK toxin-antitoxin module
MARFMQENAEMERVNLDDLVSTYAGGTLITWQGKPFTGIAYEKTDDGQIISERTYIEGLEDGPERTWYLDGQLESESGNKWNRAHGYYKEWYESGQLKAEGLMELGSLIWRKEWDEEGNQTLEYKIEDRPNSLMHLQASRSWAKREEPSYTNLSSI